MMQGCSFVNSLIYKRITEDGLLSDAQSRTLGGKEVPACIIGDSAYPINITLAWGEEIDGSGLWVTGIVLLLSVCTYVLTCYHQI